MRKTINLNLAQATGEKIKRKVEVMKLTVFGTAGQIIGNFELRPKVFKSKKRGYWATIKLIDWKAKKQFQFNAYAVEINSGSDDRNESESTTENETDNQQNPAIAEQATEQVST
jgi:hypothetical protein